MIVVYQIIFFIFILLFGISSYSFKEGGWESYLFIACIITVSIVGLMNGLSAGLGFSLLFLFLFGTLMLWNQIYANRLLWETNEIIYMMFFLLLMAVLTGIQRDWVNSVLRVNKEMFEKFDGLVSIDETTGFDNRKRFFMDLEEEFKRSDRTNLPFTLMLIRIQHMEQFIKLYGASEAEHLLRYIADQMLKEFRLSDGKYRIDSSTFAIILVNASIESKEIIVAKMERILSTYLLVNRSIEITLTKSFGVSGYQMEQSDYMELYQNASTDLEYYVQ
ncbi:GGDEF domain-containing protein [Chengkuizengella axinellae]|uniref:Diguanylate cyclase n=1 Tax=Chengkuizengella axinellae TaxID=3064388 RepID=A0ABT9J0Y1_9BACL|nr:diguanylate cyclase [Chengkuizengella sp. 2205SS18-9]MDP5275275.1 diguanylate cyclase [Chengkuizengella sp. 2205SS18-9]